MSNARASVINFVNLLFFHTVLPLDKYPLPCFPVILTIGTTSDLCILALDI